MQTLTTLVRNLALILLLATFLEMLLPNKSMRGFVQMVMGLFVISAVLAPITTFLHTPLSLDIPAWSTSTPRDLPAIAVEGEGQKIARDAVQDQYRQILVNQIRGLALGTTGVADADVDVIFADGSGGLTDQPKIDEIKVILKASQDTIQSIQPIIIGKEAANTAAQQSSKTEEVRERVSTFMSIPKDKVIVEEN